MSVFSEFTKGFYKENPTFRIVLGLCPVLAVTTSVENGIGMGIATTMVLVASNFIISLFRKLIPNNIRIPVFIVIAATFVCIVEMLMQAYAPDLYKALGIFVPLIVVNCIILGRAEAFACKNPVMHSIADGVGMGLGFTINLIIVSAIREMLGNGSVYGMSILPSSYQPVLMMILPPGAFLTLGYLLGLSNWFDMRKKNHDKG
ncbi:MAG: electron transport complex subunit E [Candidatus Latescibacter sp.]|nr:electron transport complex subunit E [Candidatus Latescibacter sp.]